MTVEQLRSKVISAGYTFFEQGDYNVNLVGIRTSKQGDKVSNRFDDFIYLAYKVHGSWVIREYAITTDYGWTYAKEKLGNPQGTALLMPGRWKYKLGFHHGKPALVQAGPVTVLRDSTLDGVFNGIRKDTGYFGINIHRAGSISIQVDNWSAGCQVFKREQDFEAMLDIVHKSIRLYGSEVSYTLLNQ